MVKFLAFCALRSPWSRELPSGPGEGRPMPDEHNTVGAATVASEANVVGLWVLARAAAGPARWARCSPAAPCERHQVPS